MSRAALYTSSALRRVRTKEIVRTPARAAAASSRADSPYAFSRTPSSASRRGGFQKRKRFSPCGAPLSVTAVKGRPVRFSASSAGLPMVAEQRMNRGSAP